MPSTHSSLIYHIVYSTKDRENWFSKDFLPKLHAYIGGILRGNEASAYAVGGVADHVHLLVGLKTTHDIPEIIRIVKTESSKWIKREINQSAFGWQDGYGIFTVSASSLEKVRSYVLNQEEHHRTMTFKEEYIALLKKCGVEFNEKFLW